MVLEHGYDSVIIAHDTSHSLSVTPPSTRIQRFNDEGKRCEKGRTRGREREPIEEAMVVSILSAGTAPMRPV
jgi:hypothetical protein